MNYSDVSINDFTGGLNLRAGERNVPAKQSPNLYNIDIRPDGGFVKSNGYVTMNSLALFHKVLGVFPYQPPIGRQQNLFACGKNIYRLNSDGTTTQINTESQSSSRKTTFIQFNDVCMIMNGVDPIRIWDGSVMSTLTTFPGDMPTSGYPSRGLEWNNKLFLYGDDTNPFQYYVSGAGDHSEWRSAEGAFAGNIGRGDGKKLQAIKPFFNYLVFHKENGMWAGTGISTPGSEAQDEFTVKKLFTGFGCDSPDAIANTKTDQLFISGKTLRSLQATLKFGDVEAETISYRVQPLLDTLNTARSSEAYALEYPNKDEVWFFFPTGASNQNNTCLVWNAEVRALTRRTGFTAACGAIIDGLPVLGTYDGRLCKHDFGGNYDGLDIYARYDTNWNAFGNPTKTTKIRSIDITAKQFGNWNLPVYCAWDYNAPQSRFDVKLQPDPGAALWGVAEWGVGVWSTPGTVQDRRVSGIGQGKTLQLQFKSLHADQPFFVQAIDCSAAKMNYRSGPRRSVNNYLNYSFGMDFLVDENDDYIVSNNDEYIGVQ